MENNRPDITNDLWGEILEGESSLELTDLEKKQLEIIQNWFKITKHRRNCIMHAVHKYIRIHPKLWDKD